LWGQKPVHERVRILRKFQALLVDSIDEITAVLNQDCGKSRQDALAELFVTLDMLHSYNKHAPEWLSRQKVSSGLYIFKQCYVEPRPYGVVAVIAPWNYPFALTIPPLLAALIAGNTVVLKPSEVTAATGVLIEQLLKRAPELAPFVRVLHGDGSVGAALVKAAPDYIFVTGSTPTGRKVVQAAAENLIPVACELGGKDALIVLDDADLRAAAHWCVWGAFFNAGQTCMAVERVYVMESVYDEFVRLCVEETKKITMGYSTDLAGAYYVGPVTDPRQIKTIERHTEDALAKGARILAGGRRDGMFFEPTVMVDVDHTMLLMRDETFGPILPIMKTQSEAEAIRLANDCYLGLGASVWSRDLKHAQRVAHQIEAASVVINDTIAQFAVPLLPFGGIKQSGSGRTHGREGLMQFTRPYSYVVGQPPIAWDVATIGRQPGHYGFLSAIAHLVFGVTPQQRIRPVIAGAQRLKLSPARRGVAIGAGAVMAALGALMGLGFASKRARPHR
jgi:acyl-CoA reductase-like NAD-dependent aldehyde dehydrogenase